MKYTKILILAICFIGIGCDDFLELDPISSIEESEFFTNDIQVYSGLVGMYDAIQGENFLETGFDNENNSAGIQYEFYVTEMRSDNTFMRDPEGESGEFDRWEITSSNTIVANYYKSFYEIIFRANKVLEYVGNADEENREKYSAEARFVRAYAYFNLVRLFGDIPLLDSLEDVETDARFTRVSSNEVYTFIEDELKGILEDLDNTYKSRASLAAAQALLAKVNLTVKDYTEAKIYCEAIINSNEFKLEDNFKDVFYNELNDEVIFSVGYISDISDASQGFSSEWITETNGINNVTSNVSNSFINDEGVDRALYSYRSQSTTRRQITKFLASEDENLDIIPTAIDEDFAGNDWIVLRYADVYLMYVEAVMAEENSTTDANAIEYFEAVRSRAGVKNLNISIISKEELLEERRLELAFENHRFFDLVRFEVATDVLQNYGLESGNVFTDFDLLLPIPNREIVLSGGLMEQNQGY